MLSSQENSFYQLKYKTNNFHFSKALNLKKEIVKYCKENSLYTPYYIEKLEDCGTPISNNIKEHCRLIICPLCYIQSVNTQRKKIQQRQKQLSSLTITTNLLTITFCDVTENEFIKRYNYLSMRFTRLIRNKQFNKLIQGTAKTIETSFADTGRWHVHLHILLAYNGTVEKEKLSKIIEKTFPDCLNVHFHEQESPLNLVAFFDYVTKINDCEPCEWIAFRNLAKKKKKISFTGILKIRASPNKKQKGILQ